MGKELNTLEITIDTNEINAVEQMIQLDDLSLALIGGGQATVSL